MKKSGNITDMSTVEDVYTALRDYPINSERGTAFEKLMARYFQLHPTLRQEYDRVVRWPDWEFNGGRADTGIDLVAHRSDDDSWTAIQCKFYEQSTTLTKGAVLEPQQPEITNSKEGVTSGFLCFWGRMNVECVPGELRAQVLIWVFSPVTLQRFRLLRFLYPPLLLDAGTWVESLSANSR